MSNLLCIEINVVDILEIVKLAMSLLLLKFLKVAQRNG